MCFTKNENLGELPDEQINRLQNDLHTQTNLHEELRKQLNDLYKLVNECYDMIQKQDSKIKILENELEHEKKKNLSSAESSDSSPNTK